MRSAAQRVAAGSRAGARPCGAMPTPAAQPSGATRTVVADQRVDQLRGVEDELSEGGLVAQRAGVDGGVEGCIPHMRERGWARGWYAGRQRRRFHAVPGGRAVERSAVAGRGMQARLAGRQPHLS